MIAYNFIQNVLISKSKTAAGQISGSTKPPNNKQRKFS
jgi:hypothetical protein